MLPQNHSYLISL
jgi:hypothetical protein